MGGARLALAVACLGIALAAAWQLAVTLTGDADARQTPPTPREPGPAGPAAASETAPGGTARSLLDVPGRGLALGITEPNPALIWSPAARPSIPAPFAAWRDALGETRPAVYRLMVSWRHLQPQPGGPVVLGTPQSGCLRARGPLRWVGGSARAAGGARLPAA